MTLGHPAEPPAAHDLWGAWNADPLLIAGLATAAVAYALARSQRRRRAPAWAGRCFAAALLTLSVALLSPLDTLSGSLASAHMVQHLLLVLVAAPLLALSAPWTTVFHGSPLVVRRATGRWRKRLQLTRSNTRALRSPMIAWLLHVGTLWFWHAAVPYGAALEHEAVHVLEHGSFLVTGVMFWRVIVDASRTSPGFGVLLLFATAMQGVFLSALLTFARAPWYAGYADTTRAWGLEPLADQQLAGVIMWIPGGVVYFATALALLAMWIRHSEQSAVDPHSRQRLDAAGAVEL